MPMPPSWARAIAIACSVTVSIGELKSGTVSRIRFVSWVETSTSAGTTSLYPGCSSTSSNVTALHSILSERLRSAIAVGSQRVGGARR
jgi:hypothetical protein